MRIPPLRINPIRCRRPTPVDNHTAAPTKAIVKRLPARMPFTTEKLLLAGGVAGVVCSIAAIKVNQTQCTANQNMGMRKGVETFHIGSAQKGGFFRAAEK